MLVCPILFVCLFAPFYTGVVVASTSSSVQLYYLPTCIPKCKENGINEFFDQETLLSLVFWDHSLFDQKASYFDAPQKSGLTMMRTLGSKYPFLLLLKRIQ
jgi:hypothetical protein